MTSDDDSMTKRGATPQRGIARERADCFRLRDMPFLEHLLNFMRRLHTVEMPHQPQQDTAHAHFSRRLPTIFTPADESRHTVPSHASTQRAIGFKAH